MLTASVPEIWRERCDQYGANVVAWYASGGSPRSKTLVVAGRPPIYDNPKVQALGRKAEVAACLILGINPEIISWSTGADPGVDIYAGPFHIDVKASDHPKAKLLIWPVSKNHFIDESSCNVLLFLREVSTGCFEAVGWVTMEVFIDQHVTASNHDPFNLTEGTFYMEEGNLWPVESLRASIRIASFADF
jgi:hypothetical protein